MNSEHRINELKTRQVFYGSSMVCKLRKEDGVFYYDILLWSNQGNMDNKSVILTGEYKNEDPQDLFKYILMLINKKKVKLGVPQT
jgi:hypothetical protein